ncbi:sensor histidine kinase [Lutibacter sp. B2]|nr:sensor histidine kinase [Lutibacter sp. B2]
MDSPYIWYALNTILITSIKLNKKYCWMNLSIYLFASTGVVYFIFDKGKLKLLDVINKESNLIISFVLITIAVQLLSKFIKKIQKERNTLVETNKQLVLANQKNKESMAHIMALYQAVESFANQRDKNDLIKVLIHYTKEISKTNTVFFLNKENEMIMEENNQISQLLKDQIRNKILDQWNNIVNKEIPIEIRIDHKRFLIVVVKSTYKNYGILGIETTDCKENIVYKENIDQLQFLAELSSVVLEKSHLEEVNERLLINEEQNRIANEIHDSVLQRLFSMSCGIFALMKNLEKVNTNQIRKELNFIRTSTNHAMKELRATIYGLSWKKDGVNTFEEDITNYVDEIKRLNNVEITFTIMGNHELLSSRHKKALYRIICEGMGNAIRHGKASCIEITLTIKSAFNLLEIVDNGIGFNFNKVKNEKQKGLGMRNIHYLADSLNGEINIDSKMGTGTTIKVTIPNSIPMITKGEAV